MKKNILFVLRFLASAVFVALPFVLAGCPGDFTLDNDSAPGSSDVGANVPFTTYEAEDADFQGELLGRSVTYNEIQSEASGRMAVRLRNHGDFVRFTLTRPANAMVLRFSMPDHPSGGGIDGSLAVYAGSERLGEIRLTSRYSWVYNIAGPGAWPGSKDPADGPPNRFFNDSRLLLGDTWPAGTDITVKKEDSIEWYVIDMAEFEVAPPPLPRPPNSLCITEFGAVADGRCSRSALNNAINAARTQGRRVWIPQGTFTISGTDNIHVTSAVVSGAGVWHSTLSGGAFFFVNGSNNRFHDFAIFGNVTHRVDSDFHCAFEILPGGANNIFENLWIENVKCGFWVRGTRNMVIRNSRIRNTFADGINLTAGTHDSIVEHNDMRNHGDDAIAINSEQNRNSTGNIVRNNTIRLPYHASGIAVYGGGNNTIENNLIFDAVAFGGGINISSRFNPTPFSGTTVVRGNKLVRTGSARSERGRNQGAIWLVAWDSDVSGIRIYGNRLIDNIVDGITIDGSAGRFFRDIEIRNNSVERAGGHGIRIFEGAAGSASFSNVSVTGAASGGLNNASGDFTVNRLGGNVGW
ncbi:MAG: right-handed parallel beta-helix repeat-containing protein [Treponema sp.]|nr:right-handed parallel beta-helix repeat-containing protein [Treponema sp.]